MSVYETERRVRRWVLAGISAAIMVGLLLIRPLLESRAQGQDFIVSRIAILLVAGSFGMVAIREGMTAAFAGVQKRQSVVTWRNLLSWALYITLLLILAPATGVNLSVFLFGGAVIGIVLATLAQASLGNVFAGLVLMVSRPYKVGESVYLRSWAFGGTEYEGIVVDIGAFYTTLSSHGQLLRVPNSSVINSVLMTRYSPLRAELMLDLPADVLLRQIEDELRSRLPLPSGARVRLEPKTYSKSDGSPRVGVRLRIYSDQRLESGDVIKALNQAVTQQGVSGDLAAAGR